MRIIFLLVTLAFSQVTFAQYKATGWQWYNKTVPQEQKEAPPEVPKMTPQQAVNYRDQIKAFQAQYEEAQAKAVVTQDVQDVARAMQLRQFMMEQSKQYGIAFQKALLLHPELSYQLEVPGQESARAIAQDLEIKRKKTAIASFAQTHGVFFFYKGQDVYTQGMAGSVQSFCTRHDMTLIGVPIDGYALPAIAKNSAAAIDLKAWGVKAVPALFLYNNTDKTVQPFAYGYISENQIADNFLKLATDYGQQALTGDISHAVN